MAAGYFLVEVPFDACILIDESNNLGPPDSSDDSDDSSSNSEDSSG